MKIAKSLDRVIIMTNRKMDTDTHVFFYEQEFYPLSNFSAFSILWKGIRFDTSEVAYQWEKFRDHPAAQLRIQQAPSSHIAFQIAQVSKHLARPDWDTVRVDIMERILWAKVDQHEYVRRKLLETGNRILVEDSWRDSFWGWGENRQGRNELGNLWMKIRTKMRETTVKVAIGSQ
jgi:ribA/ribD-fused uncharacterized protein